MNCAECRENLVAWMEGLLDHEESLQCQTHLETCAACRAEQAAITRLQRRLVTRGQMAVEVSMVNPVMRRVRAIQSERERYSIMRKLVTRWGLGLSAAAGAAALILVVFLVSPKTQAAAAEVMAKGAKAVAKLTSIHLRGQLRSAPAENFANIDPKQAFTPVELWKECNGQGRWRIEKPGRVAVMDGESTVLFLRPSKLAVKVPAVPAMYLPIPEGTKIEGKAMPNGWAPFDTGWLHELANLSETLENELRAIKAHGWPVTLTQERGDDGKMKSVITVEAKSGLPDSDYLKNKFFMTADTRRVYTFDDPSELLESVKIYLRTPTGEQLVFAIDQIDYNQPIEAGVFQLELPSNVTWDQEPKELPDNEKYAAMTAEQAARAFFEACSREDWNEVGKFMSPVNERMKQYLGGLEIVSLGEAFTSKAYPGRFVPYEIKLKSGGVKKHNLALRKDNPAGRWQFDGGI